MSYLVKNVQSNNTTTGPGSYLCCFLQNQDLKLTSKITPNWSIPWKEKKIVETIGKIIHELAKTFALLTGIIPLITFSIDLINTKKAKIIAIEQEKLKNEKKRKTYLKITYAALAIISVAVPVSSYLFFSSSDLSLKTMNSTANLVKNTFFSSAEKVFIFCEEKISQYYVSAISGVVGTTSGGIFKYYILDRYFNPQKT